MAGTCVGVLIKCTTARECGECSKRFCEHFAGICIHWTGDEILLIRGESRGSSTAAGAPGFEMSSREDEGFAWEGFKLIQ